MFLLGSVFGRLNRLLSDALLSIRRLLLCSHGVLTVKVLDCQGLLL